MQMGSRDISHRYSGPGQCFQHLLKTEGPRGLTRGMGATVAREAPGNAIFFTVYEVKSIPLLRSYNTLVVLTLSAPELSATLCFLSVSHIHKASCAAFISCSLALLLTWAVVSMIAKYSAGSQAYISWQTNTRQDRPWDPWNIERLCLCGDMWRPCRDVHVGMYTAS